MSISENQYFSPEDLAYSTEVDMGDWMRTGLSQVFSEMGFDPILIAIHGALCIDVGNGPEIVALRSFNPSVLVVTEPHFSSSPDDRKRDEETTLTLEKMAKGVPNIKILREYFSDVVSVLDPSFNPALITRLNIFPESIDSSCSLLEEVRPILIPSGLVVLSVLERGYIDYLKKIVQKGVEGYDLRFIKYQDEFLLGSGVLVAKKVK